MKPRTWLPAVALVAAALLLYLPIVFGASFWVKDVLRYTYLQKWYLRERLLHGELPLWWAQIGLGRPFLGLVQPGVFYPGNVLLLLPLPLGYDLFTAAHAAVAALGMRAWLRRAGEDELAACVGGIFFSASGYFVSLLSNNGVYAFGLAWVPAILAAAWPRPGSRVRRLAFVGLLLALCLSAGNPQAVFFAGIALFAQALGVPRGTRARELGVVAGAAILAAAIGLVQLVPGLEVAAAGRPGGVVLEDAQHFGMHPVRFLELAWPGLFGTPYTPGWFVSPLVDEGLGVGYSPLATGIYLGLATPLLAVAALVSHRRTRLDVAMGALTLFVLVLCLGRATPAFAFFFRVVPAARMFRYPEKYFAVASLCLAYLGARGLTAAVAAPARAARVGLIALGVLAAASLACLFAAPKIAIALVPRLEGTGVTRAAAGLVFRERALWALGIGLVMWLPFQLAASGRLSASRLSYVFAAIVAADLLLAGLPLIDWAPSSTYRTPSPLLEALPPTRVANRPPLRLYRPNDKLLGGVSTPLLERATFLPNAGIEDGIDQLDAYDVFHTAAEESLWATMRVHPLKLLQVTATSVALLDDAELGAQHPLLRVRRGYPELHASIVDVEGSAPRAYLATDARVATSAQAAAMMMAAPDFVPGQSAVVEGGEPRVSSGQCTLESFRPERVVLSCRASAPAYAVLADAAFPGWHATVDGHDAPLLRANAAMRGVPVPAGTSRVELLYAPRGLHGAAIASFAALLVALGLALLG